MTKNVAKCLLMLALLGLPAAAQTDLIYPWVTNNASFRGTLIINNLNTDSVTVALAAEREPDASDEVKSQTVEVTLAPFEQLVTQASALFDQLGDGSAFMVRLTSDSSNITGGFVNVGTQSQSGSSPSQTNTFTPADATDTWLFNYMFIDGGFTAPVLINLGSTDVTATIYAYQGGQIVGQEDVTIAAGKPWAEVTGTLFPDLTGDLFLVADAPGGSVLATAFIFNEFEFLEPAMAAAQPIDSVPNPDTGGGGNENVSFSTQIQPILTASCGDAGTGCHLNGGNQRGLVLDAGQAYDEIVNVASTVVGNEILITPGDTDASYLYRKLLPVGNGNFYAGDRMPDPQSGIPFLTETETNLIRDWILQGAQNN